MMKKRTGLVLLLVLTGLLFFGCGQREAGILTEDVMLANREGTYTKAQIVIPSDYEDKQLPLVCLSHGFRGSMDSAGMDQLAYALAEEGIATIRMDFSHHTSKDPESEKRNQYTVKSMVQDQVLCADYMVSHYHIDPERIGLFGRSLGGRAVMTAANEQAGGYAYRCMVLVAPAGNEDALQHYMGGTEKWETLKEKASEAGSVTHQKVILTPEFFETIEAYTPSKNGFKFENPVLTFYNTEDYVVLPKAAIACGESYQNHRLIEVTSKESPHGLEMGFAHSELKDKIFEEILTFYIENFGESA